MKNKRTKAKRHSGRYTPNLVMPMMSYDDIKLEALEPQEDYNDWIERRDGIRDCGYLEWKERDKKKRRRRK